MHWYAATHNCRIDHAGHVSEGSIALGKETGETIIQPVAN